jgi:hypothetical protein
MYRLLIAILCATPIYAQDMVCVTTTGQAVPCRVFNSPSPGAAIQDRKAEFTKEDVDNWNKSAREGAAAAGLYTINTMPKPITTMNLPTGAGYEPPTTPIPSPAESPATSNSIAPVRYTGRDGSILSSVTQALSARQFYSSHYAQEMSNSGVSLEIQRLKAEQKRLLNNLAKEEQRLADMRTALQQQQAMDDACVEGMKAVRLAESLGMPILAKDISYAEATALVGKSYLNPTQVHIFASMERNVIENGGWKMVNGMPVLYLTFTVVGDAPSDKPRVPSGVPGDAGGEDVQNDQPQEGMFKILEHHVVDMTVPIRKRYVETNPGFPFNSNVPKVDEFTIVYGNERFKAEYIGSTINKTEQHEANNPEFSFLPIGTPIQSCTADGRPKPQACMDRTLFGDKITTILRYQDSNGTHRAVFFIRPPH